MTPLRTLQVAALALGTICTASLLYVRHRASDARDGREDARARAQAQAQASSYPAVLGAVPDFAFEERRGRRVEAKELRGRVWVADFIFTSCAGTCPKMTANMAALERRLPPGVVLVTFTVDPERDTREVLTAYAEQHGGAASERWLFVRGEREAMQRFAVSGMKLPAQMVGPGGAEEILHSSRFVLVDAEGRIRGYYEGTPPEGVERLLEDVAKLGAP